MFNYKRKLNVYNKKKIEDIIIQSLNIFGDFHRV